LKTVELDLGTLNVSFQVPGQTEILAIRSVPAAADPEACIQNALNNSIGSLSLEGVVQAKLRSNKHMNAVVVISDNTRPVPYKGPEGILWPIIQRLMECGIPPEKILILVATGTHRALTEAELREMLDPRIFTYRIPIKSHDASDQGNLEFLGTTMRGTRSTVNRDYLAADLKILTGLVESHFMAGFSGGRKSICPGLTGEDTTFIFHGAKLLSSEQARDLVLDGNPCHEEALEVASAVGADYIVNVTLNRDFRLTGVYAGDLRLAHEAASRQVKRDVGIRLHKEYDLVITHAGYVGINHYQAAKAGVVAAPVVRPGGYMIMIANNKDVDPVGSARYRTMLHLLKLIGPHQFVRLISSPDWEFVPEQWQVQMWARLFSKIPMEHFVYCSPQLKEEDYRLVPGTDGNRYPDGRASCGQSTDITTVLQAAIKDAVEQLKRAGQKEISIAYLADGPYGIPYR